MSAYDPTTLDPHGTGECVVTRNKFAMCVYTGAECEFDYGAFKVIINCHFFSLIEHLCNDPLSKFV